ncbi:isoprenylcysteine carboxylmethyltransferase family protein [Ruegeria pomeroyi]|uniref:Isoprenylcysteine carboxylmethyltransferase family protein n=2 Tax=Ruegeria TaxID=97050 RepID=A0A9Q3WHI5_9RHOB|nr:isoprenylcysteine carboxylmethyltransferase family protein [Ruegeria pomeroyi]MCE8508751.1 isoprenylcysteine carboxylmethyltransferase family protein [Ruegeria pomeroyi]MCE8514552.1 isoprenylcysteine carboxylmethyltransferase family protein [Ruegeria pomeroyi]MCE8523183.1 isoprenylcysteine carboxylmethyltransferase family protein [Ruegeria pomeroyi]MCE8527285.1 isoprenylcysteine carboxylmethyltransferase family protein [Ruegeria pomeroyi]MCE8530946.1 isoprenylcysteine carboxylmethyltransfer
MNKPTALPANQRLRINLLRLAFFAMLPLLVFSKSAWLHPEWLFDLFEVTGVFLVIAAVLGRFWSILYIGGRKNSEVMQDGPYSMCRHPLYFFSCMGAVGFGLMLGSVVLTAVLGAATFSILSATAAREEAFLRTEFGKRYDDYAARTPRILPRPSLFHTRSEITFNVETLRRNFFDALVFLSFIPLAELLEGLKEGALVPTFLIY